jgi:hypothetical protein
MVLRTTLCAHCRRQAARETCRHCASAVCEPCFHDDLTCTAPRTRVLRLGLGRRLRRIDPEGRLGLVSGWRDRMQLVDLAHGRKIAAPGKLPVYQPLLSSIARSGRVAWPLVYAVSNDNASAFAGVGIGSVRDDQADVIRAQRPSMPRELGLCPTGRSLWFRTAAETVQVWDLETREQHEHEPLPGSVLQAVSVDTASGLLVAATYGRACVHRLRGSETERLGTLRLRDADNVWIALADRCVAVVSDYRGFRGRVLRAFALDAAGVPEREPLYTYAEVEAVAGAGRDVRLQRRIVAALSPDGRFLAAATADHDIAVHDLARGRVHHLQGHTDEISLIAFTGGASALVTADHDNRVILRPRRDDRFLDLAPGQRR